MRPPDPIVHSRARLGRRYALLPLDGYPPSRLPTWDSSVVRVLASPAIGARFVEYLIDVPAGREGFFGHGDDIETFYYVLSGRGSVIANDRSTRDVREGSYGLLVDDHFLLRAQDAMRLIVLRKTFEPANLKHIPPPKSLHGHVADVKSEPFAGNEHTRLQVLIPDDLRYDLAMNVFTFDVGHGLPYVETHVMEHGLLFLEGQGMYYLNDTWMEAKQDDFIWMGAFCPQCFYATGDRPAKYIYYKNVNREIAL